MLELLGSGCVFLVTLPHSYDLDNVLHFFVFNYQPCINFVLTYSFLYDLNSLFSSLSSFLTMLTIYSFLHLLCCSFCFSLDTYNCLLLSSPFYPLPTTHILFTLLFITTQHYHTFPSLPFFFPAVNYEVRHDSHFGAPGVGQIQISTRNM